MVNTKLNERLIYLEEKFGGLQRVNQMKGGNRMRYRLEGIEVILKGYAPIYAEYLPKDPKVVVELGVLRGQGLAIWADLYPDARVIGLDNNLINFKKYKSTLRVYGAFRRNDAEVYQFDKLSEETSDLYFDILDGDQIDLFIDDSGSDITEMVLVFDRVLPYLSKNAICFFEDNPEAGVVFREMYPRYEVISKGRMTIIKINSD